jgi:hypothetical protein
MAAKSSDTEAKAKPNTNPSGASDEQIKKGELAGKVRGRDVDQSFHAEEYIDPQTGEPIEPEQTVHDVMVKPDGTTEKGDASFAKGES